ncbi:response regulator [Advenella sp. RU8]|uniref:response regulator n=1 Tax=Advenella sp. RU8 TaxID=3399575 RepID=UPI003AADCDAF
MSSIRLLYIDDEPDIREVAVFSLEMDPDLEVRSCECGKMALELIPEWKPDIILLDVMMPDMDGPTTFAHIRQLPGCADIPVVFITARAQEDYVQTLLAMGAVGVIAKPFDPITLPEQVRNFIPSKL